MTIEELTKKAAWVRRQVFDMICGAGKGHMGGSLSCTDILIALYEGDILRVSPGEPDSPDRDRFLFSKGHSAEALYAVLAQRGFFPVDLLATYGHGGSPLGGHVDCLVPGIELSTGSLGHALGVGAGLAFAAKLDGRSFFTFVLLGDGECYEGSVWESASFAAHHGLSNLVAIVDRNQQVTLNFTESINRLEPFADRWRAFGWEAVEVDGHSMEALMTELEGIRERKEAKPLVLIANTKKGRGISFMEGDLHWHHNVPKGEKLEQARKELGSDG